MLIIIGLTVVTALGAWILYYDGAGAVGFFLTFLGSVLLVSAVIVLPLSRMVTHASLAEIEAIRATAAEARFSGETLEGAAWRLRVSDANEKLASLRYWNGTVFDVWIPDAVEVVEDLR